MYSVQRYIFYVQSNTFLSKTEWSLGMMSLVLTWPIIYRSPKHLLRSTNYLFLARLQCHFLVYWPIAPSQLYSFGLSVKTRESRHLISCLPFHIFLLVKKKTWREKRKRWGKKKTRRKRKCCEKENAAKKKTRKRKRCEKENVAKKKTLRKKKTRRKRKRCEKKRGEKENAGKKSRAR